MKQIYKCFLRTLSPVHIGCDEVYEPMGFVVDEDRNELTVFHPVNFISQLNENDKKRFSDICSQGTIESMLQIYKFLRRRKTDGRSVQLCSGFIGHYGKTLSISVNDKRRIQKELNNFAISRTSFLPLDQRPYIPGSAIKGSIRTAYLNLMAPNGPSGGSREKNASMLEKQILSYQSIPNDPFRLVKVSDFMPVGRVQSKVLYAVNIKKESGGVARGPFQIVEAILPGNLFAGSIVVEESLSEKIIGEPIQLESLLRGCKIFYSKENAREQHELKEAGIADQNADFREGAVPIRVGRHSGAECVTVEGYRNIKIMARKRENVRFDDHATTFWLSSDESRPRTTKNLHPFGWAELCESNHSIEQEFESLEKEWKKSEAAGIKTTIASGEDENISKGQPPPSSSQKPPAAQKWETAVITYAPNTQTFTAQWEGKKAITKDNAVVPESVFKKLRKKKKTVMAKVKVEPYGNSFRLLKIIENGE